MPETSVLKKTIFICALGTFVALAALTASLPLNLPSQQDSMSPQIIVDTGVTAWMIVATIMGFFLAPALVYFYGSMHNLNIQKLLELVLVTGAFITTLWIIFTFSLTFGKDVARNGIMGYPYTYYMFQDTFQWAKDMVIPNSIWAVFELAFAIVTPTIVATSLAGRINLQGWLVFVFAWHILIWVPIAHIVWDTNGWFYDHLIRDFAGGIVVHQVATWSALAVHMVLGKDGAKATAVTNNPEATLWYGLIVWFLWFGFNTGKAHSADWATVSNAAMPSGAMAIASQVVVNTIAATTTSVLSAYFYDLIFERPTTATTLSTAVVLGLVSITSACGFVTVGGAMCISLFVTLSTFFVAHNFMGEGAAPNQPLSVVTIHGFGGVWGFLGTAIFEYQFINYNGFNGLTYGRGIPLSHHISAVLAIVSSVFVCVYLLAFLLNFICPIGNADGEEAPASPPKGGYSAPSDAAQEVSGVEMVKGDSV